MPTNSYKDLYEGVLSALVPLFFNDPRDFLNNFSDSESAYECTMGLLVHLGEEMNTPIPVSFINKFSADNFKVKKNPVNKLGIFKQKKLYDVLTIDLWGSAETDEFKKLYFIYNSDFSDLYACVGGTSPFSKAVGLMNNDTLDITIYNKDNRVLGTVSADMSPTLNVRDYATSGVKDLYEIFRKILGLGDNYRNKIVI